MGDFEEIARKDSFAAAQKLSGVIRERLEKQIIAIGDADADSMMHQIEATQITIAS